MADISVDKEELNYLIKASKKYVGQKVPKSLFYSSKKYKDLFWIFMGYLAPASMHENAKGEMVCVPNAVLKDKGKVDLKPLKPVIEYFEKNQAK